MGTHKRLSRSRAPLTAALLLAAGLATVVLAIVLATDPESAEAAFPGTNGQIVFTSNRSGNVEIWRMNPDGTSRRNLTTSSLHVDRRAAYSPNGNKIAFDTDRDGDAEMFVMNANGTSQEQLTKNTDVSDFEPTWQPQP